MSPSRLGTTASGYHSAGGSFDVLADITWFAAYWADDPGWTNPGDGNAVTGWDDGSGNARHLGDPGASSRPIFRSSTTALNNKASVEFDGSDDFLKIGSLTLAYTYSLVAVFQFVSNTASGGYGRIMDVHAGPPVTLYNNATTGNWGDLTFYGGPALSSTVTADANGHFMYGVMTNTSNDKVGVGSTAVTGEAGTPGDLTDIALASNTTGGTNQNSANIRIAFAAVYSGDITADGNWGALKTWINSNYGVTT